MIGAIEKRYPTLIPVLDLAQGLSLVDMDRHLSYVIGDWISVLQSAVAREEITDPATLKSHSLIEWETHTRLFKLLHLEVNFLKFNCRLKLTPFVDEKQREFEFDQNTDHASFRLPKKNDTSGTLILSKLQAGSEVAHTQPLASVASATGVAAPDLD